MAELRVWLIQFRCGFLVTYGKALLLCAVVYYCASLEMPGRNQDVVGKVLLGKFSPPNIVRIVLEDGKGQLNEY